MYTLSTLAICEMKMGISTVWVLLSLGGLFGGVPDASKWNEPCIFHVPDDKGFSKLIHVLELSENEINTEGEVFYSDNRAYWFRIQSLEDHTSGVIDVYCDSGFNSNRILLRETYPNFPPKARWVSEKLLYIRVWWGRAVGTDFIFDCERAEIVYKETFHDGKNLYLQTQDSLKRADQDNGINSVPLRSTP